MSDRTPQDRELRRYETVLESLEDGVYAVDPEGTIVYVNDRYAEMKGADREELIGTHIYEWVTEEAAGKARRAREELAAGDRDVGVIEYDFETAAGDTFPVEMRFAPVPGDEDIDRVGVIRDVTERKRREESLRRKNERLDEFASIVSHDLRNPLNVADGRLDLLREECDSPQIDDIERAHDRMRSLIDDLLSLARAGAELDEPERVDLSAIVERAWANVATEEATLRTDGDLTFVADGSRLEGLLENLIRNAIEHGGDAVTVTAGVLEDGAGFYVADDGPGIPEEHRESIFESGYTTAEEGTGFGLSIVERIAEAHGWAVRATEGADGGARFEVTGIRASR
ncbi:two-component system sensor histidine kinase NtrB [Halorubrum halodurans]|uniref:histidine kinase n=1 Tax=Halorubrum halodurans TaxID=1383851 RepID=A0A256ICI0_9EURY|nr:PAS domain-containing sensor histidine kinase [Halorubrum halodurans]OYR53862.1 PAS domain-containing sensor histidine kinase [Halorubrum halodurans]